MISEIPEYIIEDWGRDKRIILVERDKQRRFYSVVVGDYSDHLYVGYGVSDFTLLPLKLCFDNDVRLHMGVCDMVGAHTLVKKINRGREFDMLNDLDADLILKLSDLERVLIENGTLIISKLVLLPDIRVGVN